MRGLLTLATILIFQYVAIAQKDLKKNYPQNFFENNINTKFYSKLDVYKHTPPAVKLASDRFVILYMMRENIIRRELSFIPKKKWKRWT